MLYLNRDVKQGGRQATHPIYYGRAGDFVELFSVELHKLPVTLVRTICCRPPLLPTFGEPFPCHIDALSWKEIEVEVKLAPVAEVVKKAPRKPVARSSAKKIIITNQIEMF